MPNPNNNMNMYNQALQINRDLKKRIDRANAIVTARCHWGFCFRNNNSYIVAQTGVI